MKKIILAPDSFKGSVASFEACDIMAEALKSRGNIEVVKIPMADGGEGTLSFAASLAGSIVKSVEVYDPVGRKINAEYVINGKTAIIESAKACGLTLLDPEERNPLITTTYGVGQLVKAALSENADTIAVTLGGSSTNDCGAGFLAALGAKFSGDGLSLMPCGGDLEKIDDINIDDIDVRLKKVRLTAVCDVENPLYGKNGAAFVYAPQKGADEKTVMKLEKGLIRFAEIVRKKTGIDISAQKGTGAAGGLAAALYLLGADMRKGSEIVMALSGFDEKLKNADYVFTGEGRFDSQSFMGKVIGTVYTHASKANVPVAVFCGGYDSTENPEGLRTVCITPEGQSIDDAMRNAKENLFNAVTRFIEECL